MRKNNKALRILFILSIVAIFLIPTSVVAQNTEDKTVTEIRALKPRDVGFVDLFIRAGWLKLSPDRIGLGYRVIVDNYKEYDISGDFTVTIKFLSKTVYHGITDFSIPALTGWEYGKIQMTYLPFLRITITVNADDESTTREGLLIMGIVIFR